MASRPTNTSRRPQPSQTEEVAQGKTNSVVAFFRSETTRVVLGFILGAVLVYSLFAMVGFLFDGGDDQSILQYSDPIARRTEIHNWAGVFGAQLAQAVINGGFGLAAFLLFGGMMIFDLSLFNIVKVSRIRLFFKTIFWTLWTSVTLSFVLQIFNDSTFISFGGMHGDVVSRFIVSYIRPLGLILILLVTLLSFLVCTNKNFWPWVKSLWPRFVAWREERRAAQLLRQQQAEILTNDTEDSEDSEDSETPESTEDSENSETSENSEHSDEEGNVITFDNVDEPSLTGHQVQSSGNQEHDGTEFVINSGEDHDEEHHGTESEEHDVKPSEDDANGSDDVKADEEDKDPDFNVEKPVDTETSRQLTPLEQFGPYDPHAELSHYQFPTLDLLKVYPDENKPVIDMEEQQANKEKIVRTLADYGIGVERINATIGPTITLYEIVPKAGIRINKIRNLESDIMLSLAATGIRIIAPIPGKGTVGIEVPNKKSQVVSMHSVIASRKFQEESKFALPVALGRTITNEVFMFDLAKAPHLLVAGATGQGKSVGLNAIITSLLYKKHPSELKFVLVDPKMVEFNIYAKIEKQYMAKLPDEDDVIITDSTKVIQTLNSLVVEMEERYKLLMKASCRNIIEYNEKFINRQLNPEHGHRYLPYIVIVIDEFGDFIMVAGKEVEMPISRITQKARAVGMHMILATQRPSVNVITGIIKANIPARIAFRVQSQIDSRTILDTKGADQLVGRGDLLYSAGQDPVRVQCAFVDTPEVEKITEFISEQQAYPQAYQLPEYTPEGGDGEGGLKPGEVDTSHLDPMFADIARFVVAQQQGSTSVIQRKFNIGYNRAGRLSDQLEATGIVGPNNGPKGRAVLVQDEMTLAEIFTKYNVY
ncbi:MAG TPA: cell division protein FtsK [Bacteroidales bacterium]|nr:cell division protein FtsK [Bacteroidales bacterium]